MLKFLVFLLAVTLLTFVWAAFRRRLKLAFKVVAVIYVVGALARLAQMWLQTGLDERRASEFGLVVAALLAFWALVWAATRVFATRRHSVRPRAAVTPKDDPPYP